MNNKIYLDSGVVITLGILHNYCKNKLKNKITPSQIKNVIANNKADIKKELQNDVNILDFDIDGILDLYTSIMEGKVDACVPPFVFKEITMDTNRGELTMNFFKHCYLAMPENESLELDFMPLKTIALDHEIKKVPDVPDSSNPSITYGLSPDIHFKDGEWKDLNIEDRWILSQVNYLAQIDPNKIEYTKGDQIFFPSSTDKLTPKGRELSKKIDELYYETKQLSKENYAELEQEFLDLLKTSEQAKSFIVMKKNEKGELVETISHEIVKEENKFLFLQQNEKDYGRENLKTRRTKEFSEDNSTQNRDAKALHKVKENLEGVALNTNISTYNSPMLKQFIKAANDFINQNQPE